MSKLYKIVSTLALVFGLAFSATAGQHTFLARLSGSAINAVGASMNVEDTRFMTMVSNPNYTDDFTNHTVKNYLYLEFTGDEKDYANLTTAWDLDVTVEVDRFSTASPMTPASSEIFTISISYDPATVYIDAQAVDIGELINGERLGMHKLHVHNIVAVAGPSGNLPPSGLMDDIVLESKIMVERYDKLDLIRAPSITFETEPTPVKFAQHEGEFAWSFTEGAEEYDLEFLYVDDHFDNTLLNAAEVDFSDATRITTEDNRWRLNLVYETGHLYYRVRAVGRGGTDFRHRIEGPWSHGESGPWTAAPAVSVAGANSNPHLIDQGYYSDRSYGYKATYAEHGFKHEELEFADETGRLRQKLTKSNTSSVATIVEAFYDFEGRHMATSLAVPTLDSKLAYYQNASQSNGGAFDRNTLDAAANYLNAGGQVLLNGGETGNYFSTNNTLAQTDRMHHYLPEAEGFAYSRTIYGMDGTMKRQSGVGDEHSIGSGHETFFYYGTPWQIKLDQLFGTEAGFAPHYRVEVLRDANGQHSMVYKNIVGEIIATCLVGDVPRDGLGNETVDALPANIESVVTDMNDLNQYHTPDEAWVVENQIFASWPGNYDFTYDLSSVLYDAPCSNTDYHCTYDVVFTVVDDCNEPMAINVTTGGSSNTFTGSYSFTWSTNSPPPSETFWVNFPEVGTYRVRKELRLNESAFQTAVADFRADLEAGNTTCITDLATLIADFTATVDQAGCGEQPIDYPDMCSGFEAIMGSQLSPQGQYFDNLFAGGGSNAWLEDNLWPDNTTNGEWTRANWVNPNTSQVITNWAELRSVWQPGWDLKPFEDDSDPQFVIPTPITIINSTSGINGETLDYLAMAHPEYCHYEFCNRNVPSTNFDFDVSNYQYSTAASSPNFFIVGTAPNLSADAGAILAKDPFFNLSLFAQVTGSSSWYLSMRDMIDASNGAGYPDPNGGSNLTMWEFALYLSGLEGCGDLTITACRERTWGLFWTLYLAHKQTILVDFKTSSTGWDCATLYDAAPADGVADFDATASTEHNDMVVGANILFQDGTAILDAVVAQGTTWESFNGNSYCEQLATTTIDVTGGGTVSITVGGVEITGIVTTTASTNEGVAAEIVAAINNHHSIPDYHASSASGTSATITIYADLGAGTSANTLGVLTAGFTTGNTPAAMAGGVDASDPGCPSVAYQHCFCIALDQALEDEYGTNLPSLAVQDQLLMDQLNAALDFVNNTTGVIYVTLAQVTDWHTNCSASLNSPDGQSPIAAGMTNDLPEQFDCVPNVDPCDNQEELDISSYYANWFFNDAVEAALEAFEHDYRQHCLGQASTSALTEDFGVAFDDREHHYTLFYYDQARNLVRTVPPKGVEKLAGTALNDVPSHRDNPSLGAILPNHKMLSRYRQNSLDDDVETRVPDRYYVDQNGDVDVNSATRAWYDQLGRLRFTQDELQYGASVEDLIDDVYSYVRYDDLGRAVETGECRIDQAQGPSYYVDNDLYPTANRTEINYTFFDNPLNATVDGYFEQGQQNLRNRVSSITYWKSDLQSTYDYATHYSYDRHIRATEIVQETTELLALNEVGNPYQYHLKRMLYDFDRLTGAPSQITFQPGEQDQFVHRYYYDADNRLIEFQTSEQGEIWEREAEYFYYLHGPMARVEIGDKKVQGQDLYYTIQGWLKGINSNSLNRFRDPGNDAHSQSVHANVALDEMGLSLGYFTEDYEPIGNFNVGSLAVASLQGQSSASDLKNDNDDLFNSNISHTVTAIGALMASGPIGMSYRYDQLHRLTETKAYTNLDVGSNRWQGDALVLDYSSPYYAALDYDENGNVLHLQRNGILAGFPDVGMDDITYHYQDADETSSVNYSSLYSNRLKAAIDVGDNIDPNANFGDIRAGQGYDSENLNLDNYQYDANGQLVADLQEEIAKIHWNAAGMITYIERNDENSSNPSSKADLEFKYDAGGHRAVKVTKPRVNGVLSTQEDWEYTYYVYDAAGNVLATYSRDLNYVPGQSGQHIDRITLTEQHLLGGSRVGIKARQLDMGGITHSNNASNPFVEGEFASTGVLNVNLAADLGSPSREIGLRRYEQSNHLGNVLTVVSDRKIATLQAGTDCEDFESALTFTEVNPALTDPIPWYHDAGATLSQVTGGNSQELQVITTTTFEGVHRLIPTVLGEEYTVSFYLDQGTTSLISVAAYDQLPAAGINVNFGYVSSGLVTVTFTANGSLSRIKITREDVNGNKEFKIDDFCVTGSGTGQTGLAFQADVMMYSDYYPFGMAMPGRQMATDEYRYGFNGMEHDDEVRGLGNAIDFGGRSIYDPRLARFQSIDPSWRKYPHATPYSYAANSPISMVDMNGNDPVYHAFAFSHLERLRRLMRQENYSEVMRILEYGMNNAPVGDDGLTSYWLWNQYAFAKNDNFTMENMVDLQSMSTRMEENGRNTNVMPLYGYNAIDDDGDGTIDRIYQIRIGYIPKDWKEREERAKRKLAATLARLNAPKKEYTEWEKFYYKWLAYDALDGVDGGTVPWSQGKKIMLGTVAVVTAPLAIVGATGYFFTTVGYAGLANGVDDMFTNSDSESLTQQLFDDPDTKAMIGDIKTGVTIVTFFSGVYSWYKWSDIGNTWDLMGTYNDSFSLMNAAYEHRLEEERKKAEQKQKSTTD